MRRINWASTSTQLTDRVVDHIMGEFQWEVNAAFSRTPREHHIMADPDLNAELAALVWGEGPAPETISRTWTPVVDTLTFQLTISEQQMRRAFRETLPDRLTPNLCRFVGEAMGHVFSQQVLDNLSPEALEQQLLLLPESCLYAQTRRLQVRNLSVRLPPWQLTQVITDFFQPQTRFGTYNLTERLTHIVLTPERRATLPTLAPRFHIQLAAMDAEDAEYGQHVTMLRQMRLFLLDAKTIAVAKALWPNVGLILPPPSETRFRKLRDAPAPVHPRRSNHYRALLTRMSRAEWASLIARWEALAVSVKMLASARRA